MTDDARESSSNPTRILVVDDHELVRKGICALLYEVPGFQVVGEARDGQEAVSCAKELEPDVILMDLRMPVMDGIEATRQITAARRESAVLVLTGTGANDDVLEAIRAGAAGYLLKDSSAAELVRGIRRVARGETSIDSTLARRLLLEVGRRREREPIQEALTQRETMVLQCLAVGLTNRAIGRRLEISERTVRTHVSHILAKLQLHTRTQAALFAVRNGIAAPSEMQSEMQVEGSDWASPDSRMRPTAASAK